MRPGFSGIRARDQLESNLGSHWQPTVDIDLESKRPKLDDATVEDPLLADPDCRGHRTACSATLTRGGAILRHHLCLNVLLTLGATFACRSDRS